ncbi:Hypothetical protein PAU_03486 [Photorhabdus asymbiotica]|uniref:Uncharacterized protein n=1 Tax=Photorhabdus asymbiotica subsp. asymbiotica (strain ATCC 43949 / 3105-77) TaxID=553480 RepID=C7BJP9_PHOAA|nr:Hypothetical protein PAU_03486 [Photorhabdus asymbiotica]
MFFIRIKDRLNLVQINHQETICIAHFVLLLIPK